MLQAGASPINMRASEIDLVLAELKLEGCMLQTISQPSFPELFLYFSRDKDRRLWLRFSSLPGEVSLARVTNGPPRQRKEPRYSQLLRARLGGARVVSASQLGQERVVRIELQSASESLFVFLRLWGGAANSFLTDENLIIVDAQYRRPGRNEVSGQRLDLPDPAAAIQKEVRPPRLELIQQAPSSAWPEMPLNWALSWHYSRAATQLSLQNKLQRAESLLEARASFVSSRIRGLQAREYSPKQIEDWQRWGQILSSKSGLELLEGRENIVIGPDWWNPPAKINIEIDPAKSLQENAERYFQLARKAEASAQRKRDELALFESELADLNAALARLTAPSEIDKAADPSWEEFLDSVIARWQASGRTEGGGGAGSSGGKKEAPPGLEFNSGGFRILVGRSSAENDKLLRRHVRGNDIWLHCRNYPGGYVFIISKKEKTVPLEVLLDAAQLALKFSKAKESSNADIHYTFVKFLRRVRNGRTGLVIPTQDKNLGIRQDKRVLDRLFGRADTGADTATEPTYPLRAGLRYQILAIWRK